MEIGKGSDVLLPRLYIVRIHRYLLLLVGVFIGKSGKGMAKLMHNYRLEPFLVAGGEIV